MKTGVIISTLVHGIFLLLMIVEPMWKSPSRPDEIIINEVTLISAAAFDASLSDTPVIPDANIAAMTQPVVEVDDAARPEEAQAPEATEMDITEAPSARDDDPDLSAVERLTQPEVAVVTAQPSAPNILPQVSPSVSMGMAGNSASPVFLAAPQPRSAPRIDSFSAPALPDDARASDRVVEATAPDETAIETVEEATPEATPEALPESVTEIVPEAQPDVAPSAAPPLATRPLRRSANVARAAAAVDAAVREAEEAAIRELLDAAVAEAAVQAVEEPTTVALTGGQRQGIIEAVSRNWNKSIVVGKENFEQLVIVLEVSVAPNGMIISGSVKPLEPSIPQGDFEVAYEAARRSVLRAEVIPLPAGQYPEGVRLELTFDPALNEAGFN